MNRFYQSHLYQDFFSLISTVIKTAQRNYLAKKFEPEVEALARIIKQDSICIDVGGAYGRYAFPLSKIVGSQGKIYSFEPGSYSYRVFWCIKLLFGLKNVVLTKKAVSDKTGEIQLCLPLKKSGKLGASLAYVKSEKDPDAFCEVVKMITLDNFSQEEQLSRVDLIKCDTEGSELFVFKGAKRLIEKFRPIVLTEIDEGNLARYQLTVADLLEFFSPWNYRLAVWQNNQFVPKTFAENSGNYFFIPEHIKNL